MNIPIITIVFSFLFCFPSQACNCSHDLKPDDLFRKSDLVFVGSKLGGKKTDSISSDLSFTIHRFAKGDETKFGSDKISIKWQGDEGPMCRAYLDNISFLIFAVKNKEGTYSFLTDCKGEVITAEGPNYEYKGKKFVDFKFFKVNVLSAFNGMRPRYAVNISETEAKDLAKNHLFQNAEFRKHSLKDLNMWKPVSAEKREDANKQVFWRVQMAYSPPRAKGEFYNIDFYNTLTKSFHIGPGE